MDEEALLGEAAGPIGEISKEEEDALLNDEPTTSATTVIAAAVEQMPADSGEAPPAAAATEADEDELMDHTDTESNEASESSSQSPAPSSSLYNTHIIKSVIAAKEGQFAKIDKKNEDKTRKRLNRIMELTEDQRNALRKIVNMGMHQNSIQLKLKELSSNFENLAAQQGVQYAEEAVFATPAVPQQRTAAARPPVDCSSSNSRKRRGQPEQAPPARRSIPASQPVQQRRSSNGTPSPVVQQLQLQQQRSAPPMRVQRTVSQPTPPQRAVTARPQQPAASAVIPEPLPRPGQYQQVPSFGSKTTPAGVRQHANGQRLQQVVQQHQPTPQRSSSMNGVPAAASASSSSTGMTQAQRAAAEKIAATLQQQQSRKRPHPQSQQQLVQQAVSAGSSSGGSAAAMTTDDKIRWCLLASTTLLDARSQQSVQQMLAQTRHVERMEQELAANAAEARPSLVVASRRLLDFFVVPPPNEKRKIEIAVEKQRLADPTTRPNQLLPVDSDWVKNDRFAPQIELVCEHEDFTVSGKVCGRIRFTAPSSWPENTARICLYYYIGTTNSQEWIRSDFATVELARADDKFKEATVRFIFTLGPEYFHMLPAGAQQRAVLHPAIWKETIGMVAFACAGDSAAGTECKLRGDEKSYDFGAQKALSERRKMERYGANFAGFYQRCSADVARLATPENRMVADQKLRELQLLQQQTAMQQQAALRRAAQAAAADDDDDIAIIN